MTRDKQRVRASGQGRAGKFENAAAHLPSATCGEREQRQVGAEFSGSHSTRVTGGNEILRAFTATAKL